MTFLNLLLRLLKILFYVFHYFVCLDIHFTHIKEQQPEMFAYFQRLCRNAKTGVRSNYFLPAKNTATAENSKSNIKSFNRI